MAPPLGVVCLCHFRIMQSLFYSLAELYVFGRAEVDFW